MRSPHHNRVPPCIPYLIQGLVVFRSRKKISTTYVIVSFFVFFSPDLFMKKPIFSKTVHMIFIKFCTVILHPKGPVRAQRHQSFDWNVRNIAKLAQKQPFFDFFRFSQKLFIRFKRNFVQSFYTISWSFVCNFIKFVALRCEKHSQKWPRNSHFSTFFDFCKNCRYDSTKVSTVIF